ncbi:MAG TPA: 4Fe-4S ferredoxin [Clostridiales bacterium]|nr:4Fe-4S ferredoxin [Clostridiales bacterium]
MGSEVLFANTRYDKYDVNQTLPAKFDRIIDAMHMEDTVKGKWTAIKMHVGRNMGYSTVHPLFVKKLVDKLKSYGAKVFITDQVVSGARARGYTEDYLGVPVVQACGVVNKYYYEKQVDFKTFKNVDVAGHIHDAQVMIDFSHVKGHGVCGYGGACKNIAMGCVTDRTRQQIHGLEGGLEWNEELCIHCEECVSSCNHNANSFSKEMEYKINYHHCTYCQHCVKVCPTQAIKLDAGEYVDFQKGMALCTAEVLKGFKPDHVFYINFLMDITALCDCWGMTTPSLVPDIGIMASKDIVAIERASLDAIKFEDLLISGVPYGMELGDHGHLFERLHGKNPFVQLDELEARGLGTQQYTIKEIG